jgi:sugar phosphate isomerase/epimerase
MIYHAHMKDTVLSGGCRKMWRVEFVFEKSDLPSAPGAFRAVGYGHGAATWQAIIHAYMDLDYDGILSIENEEPILTGEVSVERAAYVLKNVRNEILGS